MEKRKERTDHLEETPNSPLPYSDFGDSMIGDKQQMTKKVFVSGCYDLLHSGHVEFFQQASRYGDLYVGIGSDATYLEYKHRKPMFPQEERLFMVKNIKAVKDAYINEGYGLTCLEASANPYTTVLGHPDKAGAAGLCHPHLCCHIDCGGM